MCVSKCFLGGLLNQRFLTKSLLSARQPETSCDGLNSRGRLESEEPRKHTQCIWGGKTAPEQSKQHVQTTSAVRETHQPLLGCWCIIFNPRHTHSKTNRHTHTYTHLSITPLFIQPKNTLTFILHCSLITVHIKKLSNVITHTHTTHTTTLPNTHNQIHIDNHWVLYILLMLS